MPTTITDRPPGLTEDRSVAMPEQGDWHLIASFERNEFARFERNIRGASGGCYLRELAESMPAGHNRLHFEIEVDGKR